MRILVAILWFLFSGTLAIGQISSVFLIAQELNVSVKKKKIVKKYSYEIRILNREGELLFKIDPP